MAQRYVVHRPPVGWPTVGDAGSVKLEQGLIEDIVRLFVTPGAGYPVCVIAVFALPGSNQLGIRSHLQKNAGAELMRHLDTLDKTHRLAHVSAPVIRLVER